MIGKTRSDYKQLFIKYSLHSCCILLPAVLDNHDCNVRTYYLLLLIIFRIANLKPGLFDAKIHSC